MRARDNPFRTERVLRLRYRLGIPWADLLARWESRGRRAAILGPHGTGKSTLLDGLADVLGCVARLRLNEEDRRLPDPLPEGTLLLDGAEQLDARGWRRVLDRPGGLLVTAHQPVRLPTLWECRTSTELLDGLLEELGVPEWRERGCALFAERAGNLREVLRGLYDLCALDRVPGIA